MGEMKESTARPATNNFSMIFLKIWLALIVFVLPLLFVPSLFSIYTLPKTVLLIVGVLVGWGILIIQKSKIKSQASQLPSTSPQPPLSQSPTTIYQLPFIVLTAVFIISSLLQPTAAMRINALTGQTAIIFAGVLLALLIAQLPTTNYQLPIISFLASTVILSLISILQYVGLLSKWIGWSPLKQTIWTPTGSILTTLALILVSVVYLIMRLIKNIRANQLAIGVNLLILVLLVVLVLGEILGVLALIESKPLFVSPTAAWVVAVEGFKTAKTAFLGVGPGNFKIAYRRFRPMMVNNTSAWNFYFNSSFGEYLNLLTEVGLLGLAALAWIVLRTFSFPLIPLLLLALFIPFDISLWVIFFLLLGSSRKLHPDRKSNSTIQQSSNVAMPLYITLIPPITLILLLAVSSWWYGRALWADALFAKSLSAFDRGEGGNAYNLQVKALEKNPHIDTYHAVYASTNLALANSLSQRPDLSDQQEQQVTILVQQAIREAKAAAAVNPLLSSNWQNLAGVYQQIIGVAEGAEGWTIDSLSQAVALDPVSPNLRVDLGGMFFSLGDYDSAQRQFEMAVNLKPDYANAHYNLSAAYQKQEKWGRAVSELETVLSLIEPNTADFNTVQEELKELAKKVPEVEAPVAETQLQPPQETLPTPPISPMELPEETVEEMAPEIPTPEPTEEAIPSPQP